MDTKYLTLLKANKASQISSKDIFMLMALWMEKYPSLEPKTSQSVRKTGCVLVDKNDRILSLQSTGETHAIIRSILTSKIDPKGCDM
jgi:pyrimidine deaminase RibD-like protein